MISRFYFVLITLVSLFVTNISIAADYPSSIQDGAHGGNSKFYFLEPMVEHPWYVGEFDDSLLNDLTVEIVELSADSYSNEIVTISTHSNKTRDRLRLDADAEHYIANWHTRDFDLDLNVIYRINIKVVDTLIGYANVQVYDSMHALKNDPNDLTKVLYGKTLPIKFRIEDGAVFVIGSEGGVIQSPDGRALLEISSGALAAPAGIVIMPKYDYTETSGLVTGSVYEFLPDGLEFINPVSLTMRYDPSELWLDPQYLTVLTEEKKGEWTELTHSVFIDTSLNQIVAEISGFSGKAIGSEVQEVLVDTSTTDLTMGETVQAVVGLVDPSGKQLSNRTTTTTTSTSALQTSLPTSSGTLTNVGSLTQVAPGSPGSGVATLATQSGNAVASMNVILQNLSGFRYTHEPYLDEDADYSISIEALDNNGDLFVGFNGVAQLSQTNANTAFIGGGDIIFVNGVSTPVIQFADPVKETQLVTSFDVISTPSDLIGIIDVTPPVINSVLINNGVDKSFYNQVSLSFSVVDNTKENGFITYQISSNDGISWGRINSVEVGDMTSSIELNDTWYLGEGSQTIWVRVIDSYGNVSTPVSDSIIVDTLVTVTVTLTKLRIHNDSDPYGTGELDWRFYVAGKRFIGRDHDAGSGKVINLNYRHSEKVTRNVNTTSTWGSVTDDDDGVSVNWSYWPYWQRDDEAAGVETSIKATPGLNQCYTKRSSLSGWSKYRGDLSFSIDYCVTVVE